MIPQWSLYLQWWYHPYTYSGTIPIPTVVPSLYLQWWYRPYTCSGGTIPIPAVVPSLYLQWWYHPYTYSGTIPIPAVVVPSLYLQWWYHPYTYSGGTYLQWYHTGPYTYSGGTYLQWYHTGPYTYSGKYNPHYHRKPSSTLIECTLSFYLYTCSVFTSDCGLAAILPRSDSVSMHSMELRANCTVCMASHPNHLFYPSVS